MNNTFLANVYADGNFCGRLYVPVENTQDYLDLQSVQEKIIFTDVANPLYGKKLTCEPVNE